MSPLVPAVFRQEERFYAPFVAGAIFFGLGLGFPLGILIAHALAQQGTLDGHLPQVLQLHGHLQLQGWFGLFVMGMGYRLVARFTAVHVRPPWLVPLTFVLMAGGLALRALSQPWAGDAPYAGLFAASATMEAAAALVFAASIIRSLLRGRPERFVYSPFFAAGALWIAVALFLNLWFVTDAARHSQPTIASARSSAITFVQLYGFAVMFVLGVSLRTFPVFFGRREVARRPAIMAWTVANAGIAAYTIAAIWRSYDDRDVLQALQGVGFAAAGSALVAMAFLLRVFQGSPHRLRQSAQRSMRFIRSAYAWLLLAGLLQAYYGLRALWAGRPPAHYETDAVRHFIAVGFVTTAIFGMAFLVLPRLAMRRIAGTPARLLAPSLLVLVNSAALARGIGSLLVNEARAETGFWTMSAGGVFGILAVAAFVIYLAWNQPPPEIPVQARLTEPSQRGIVL